MYHHRHLLFSSMCRTLHQARKHGPFLVFVAIGKICRTESWLGCYQKWKENYERDLMVPTYYIGFHHNSQDRHIQLYTPYSLASPNVPKSYLGMPLSSFQGLYTSCIPMELLDLDQILYHIYTIICIYNIIHIYKFEFWKFRY